MVTNVKKKSTAGGNGKFSYKYTDLATIHEELEKQGITYTQYTEYDEKAGADYVFTILRYGDDKEGSPIRGAKIIESSTLAGGNAAQQYGSALTYARRYSLLMALGWATEDDDGNGAGDIPPKAPTGNKVDFKQVREKVNQIRTIEELNKYWTELGLSEKQAAVLKPAFSERKVKITMGVGENGVE